MRYSERDRELDRLRSVTRHYRQLVRAVRAGNSMVIDLACESLARCGEHVRLASLPGPRRVTLRDVVEVAALWLRGGAR